jgi:hypothetical protein
VRLWSMAPGGNLLPPRWMLRSRRLPPGYYLDRLDTARFSARGYLAESVEREAWEDHGRRNGGAASPTSPTPSQVGKDLTRALAWPW